MKTLQKNFRTLNAYTNIASFQGNDYRHKAILHIIDHEEKHLAAKIKKLCSTKYEKVFTLNPSDPITKGLILIAKVAKDVNNA